MNITITPTMIWYYTICPREAWLICRHLTPDEHTDHIELGRFLHKQSYTRNKKEIQIGSAKFDIVTQKNGMLFLGEIKKSSKSEQAAKMQLAYYLYLLEQQGIKAQGELRIPKEKKIIPVELNDELRKELKETEDAITKIIEQDHPPAVKKINFCKNCAYQEFCFS